MPGRTDVQYLVLPDTTNPYLLARVRWPDVFQAISAGRPYWQDDPGLFDLPYDPSSTEVTLEQATAIAADWGARLPADEKARTSDPSLIRRMPADWSNLAPAELRAWSIESSKTGRHTTTKNTATRRRGTGVFGWWGRGRRLHGSHVSADPRGPSPEAIPGEPHPATADPRDENPDARGLVDEPASS